MSKKLTIAEVAERSGLPKNTVAAVFEHLEEATVKNLSQGFDVVIPGVGKLRSKFVQARQRHNPKTGEKVEVPAGKKVHFTISGTLKKAVNG